MICIKNWLLKNKLWLLFLAGIIGAWIISVLGLMLFKYWYFDLIWQESRISLSNIVNLGVAIGTIALAIFAWMAYRYATKQYLMNQKEEVIFKGKIDFFLKLSKYLIEIEETIKEKSKSIYIDTEEIDKFRQQPFEHGIEMEIIMYLSPFIEKLKDEIKNILAINLIFPNKQNAEELLKQYMEELQSAFIEEFGKISTPFSNNLNTQEINRLLPTLYNKDFFKTQKEKLFKISEVFLNLDKSH